MGAALLAFQHYQPFDGRQAPEQRWGPPRYLALVLTREGAPGRWISATAAFMQRYYALLKQGKGRMEALLAVQQNFPSGSVLSQWRHPRYWAAWQLVGETGPIQGL